MEDIIRTQSDIVIDFGDHISDALFAEFDPEDQAFEAEAVVAEAEAAMIQLKAAVRSSKSPSAVSEYSAQLAAAALKLSFYMGDL